MTGLLQQDVPDLAQALFKRLFLASPDAIVVTAENGRIFAVNPAAERIFGYSETEMIGNLVEILIPERFRRSHPQRREAYFFKPSVRPMGSGLELYGSRKDGSEFPVTSCLARSRQMENIRLNRRAGHYRTEARGDSPPAQRRALSAVGERRPRLCDLHA